MLEAGDKVHWTEIKQKGKGFSMTTKTGYVVSAHEQVVVVRTRGRQFTKLHTQLRKEGEQTELTDFVKDMAKQ